MEHMSNWIWVIIPLVAIILSHKRKMARGDNPQAPVNNDAERLRDEVRTLKERIAVLERIATEDTSAKALDREIEKLR